MKNLHLGRITTILIAGAMGVTACGGSDGGASLSGDDAELADALAAAWEAEGQFPDGVSMECAASGLVSGVGGAEGAARYGVNIDNISDDSFDANPLERGDALAVAGAMLECDGMKTSLVGEVSDVEDADDLSCLVKEIDDEPLTALFGSGFMGDNSEELEEEFENEFEADLLDGLESCEISA